MFPAFPKENDPELDELRTRLLLGVNGLGKGLSAEFRQELSEFMACVTSYYTNAMEGNPSRLRDIEEALANRLAVDPTQRNFQLEHIAHIETQREMLARLKAEPELEISSPRFICWLHERFYSRLPREMRHALTQSGQRVETIPGALRELGAQVGAHHPPESKAEIEQRLREFQFSYDPSRLTGSRRIAALAASHHRLLWIHPFADGNGRVARLFTIAYSYRAGVAGDLLWNVTRAFARDRVTYDRHLAMADRPRRHDYDGRGPLSEEDLGSFCRYFLACCVDQVAYMADILGTAQIQANMRRFLQGLIEERVLSKNSARVLEALLRQGSLKRSEIGRLCGVQQRQASKIIGEVLRSGFAKTPSSPSYGPLELRLTTALASALFPDLA